VGFGVGGLTLTSNCSILVDRLVVIPTSQKPERGLTVPKWALVVDDDPGMRMLVKDVLEIAGFVVLAVCDAEDALHVLELEGEKYELIISDKDMPGMSGVELMQRCKGNATTSGIRFILMSGGRVVSDRDLTPLSEVCAKCGVTFLQKPFRVDGLLELVRS